MSLKAGDKIRFKHTGSEYEIVYSSVSNLAYFSRAGTLSCPFEVENPYDIRKSEFETQYNTIHWEHLDGGSLFDDTTYRIGQRFMQFDEEYILAQIETNKVCMVSLSNGNRFDNPQYVKDSSYITEKEFRSIANEDFVLVK